MGSTQWGNSKRVCVCFTSGDGQRLHPLSGAPGVRERRRQHHPRSRYSDGHRPAAAGRAHAQER